MRRWNGWGDDATEVPLPPAARTLLERALQAPVRVGRDLTHEEALARVPASRLPARAPRDTDAAIATGAAARLRHAHGQGFPDLVALRTGVGLVFPDGVATPRDDDEVRALLAYAREHDIAVVPYGGGTSVVGHFGAAAAQARAQVRGDRPVLMLSLAYMAELRNLDAESRLATFGAGIAGPGLEAALAPHGFTLGHFPQSFERSTLGGWIATRSSGQESRGYGRIEQLFAGGTVVAPRDTLVLPPFPASAAGPDLRQLVLGSEGRLGVITQATVRVTRKPRHQRVHAIFFAHRDAAIAATRALAQDGPPLAMVRTSDATETATSLALSGHDRATRLLRGLLRLRRLGPEPCLMLVAANGSRMQVHRSIRDAVRIARRHGGVHAGTTLGEAWRRGRFRAPYLRDTLWEAGYAVDTVETATTWAALPATLAALEAALDAALDDDDESVLRFTHLSHVYTSGASLYTTFAFRRAPTPEATLDRWMRLREAASRAIVGAGATISHHHGIGTVHASWLVAEKGEAGLRALEASIGTLDADGIMSPGILLPTGTPRPLRIGARHGER